MKVYESLFSTMVFDPENKLLIVSWLASSKNLGEEAVKTEIMEILKCLKTASIENIIVDSREYYFRDHPGMQDWINREFMPKIMESSVRKYGIVTGAPPEEVGMPDIPDEEDDEQLTVEYFSSIDEAMTWIKTSRPKI